MTACGLPWMICVTTSTGSPGDAGTLPSLRARTAPRVSPLLTTAHK